MSIAKKTEHELRSKLEQLEMRLQTDLNLQVRDFSLRLQAGGIVLRGFANTFYAKQIAQHKVMGEIELPILANEIQVS